MSSEVDTARKLDALESIVVTAISLLHAQSSSPFDSESASMTVQLGEAVAARLRERGHLARMLEASI